MIGIYGIFRKVDDKCMYVGESKDITGRIKAHLRGNTRNTFSKEEYYGEMIEEHMINDKAFRLEREAYWIEQLNPELNVVRDERNRIGYIHQTEESKKKISAAKIGNKHALGNHHTEQWKKNNGHFFSVKKWINNGETTKRINQDELDKYIQDGWKLGRLPWKRNS